MKRFISFVVAFATLLALFAASISSAAEQPDNFSVVIGSGENHVRNMVLIPVNLKNVPAGGIASFEMSITYDPLKVRYEFINIGKIVPNGFLLKAEKVRDGELLLQYKGASGIEEAITKDGVVAQIRFDLYSIEGETPVVIESALFTDSNGNKVNAALTDGSVNVLPPYGDFNITVGSVEVNEGAQAIVPITFNALPPNGIDCVDAEVIYDPTKLDYSSYIIGKIVPSPSTNFAIEKVAEGKLRILFLNYTLEDKITNEGTLTELVFNVLSAGEDSTTIDLKASILDGFLNPLITTIHPGTVTIIKPLVKYTVKGYIKPDFIGATSAVNSGFEIKLSSFSAVTDEKGYFEIKDVPAGNYYITISKDNYLTREIKDYTIDSDIVLSTAEKPIVLWAGDVVWAGDYSGTRRDGAINMWDITYLCTFYNSVKGDGKYSEALDFNMDGAINFEDVYIVAKHFNKTSEKYPSIID